MRHYTSILASLEGMCSTRRKTLRRSSQFDSPRPATCRREETLRYLRPRPRRPPACVGRRGIRGGVAQARPSLKQLTAIWQSRKRCCDTSHRSRQRRSHKKTVMPQASLRNRRPEGKRSTRQRMRVPDGMASAQIVTFLMPQPKRNQDLFEQRQNRV